MGQENKISVLRVIPGKGVEKFVDNLAHDPKGTSKTRALNDFDENVTPKRDPEYTLTIQKVTGGYLLRAWPTDGASALKRMFTWEEFKASFSSVSPPISEPEFQKLRSDCETSNSAIEVFQNPTVAEQSVVDFLQLK